jgi:hypothetical protein
LSKKLQTNFLGVHWIKQRPFSDVTDPLGMNLRVGARLGAQLLYCITSVTQRARYYSFLPWCMMRYRDSQRGAPGAPGMVEAVFHREKALAIGCVAHHEGETCVRGGVVGSRKVVRGFAEFEGKAFTPSRVKLVQDPALNVYSASLVNLGLIKETATEAPAEPGEDADDEASVTSWNDVELTDLGVDVAKSYEAAVSGAPASRQLDDPTRALSWQRAADWASVGGYCELATEVAPDREVLLDLFFCRRGRAARSHELRRQTLLLILALARHLEDEGGPLDATAFMSAVYGGRVEYEDGPIPTVVPSQLVDIAARWKAYGAHVLMTTALQCLLSHVASALQANEAHRVSLAELAQTLSDPALEQAFVKNTGVRLPRRFGELTPASVNEALSVGDLGRNKPEIAYSLAQDRLRDMDVRGGPAGFALGLTLAGLVLEDYATWKDEDAGIWLAKCSNDDEDVSPAIMLRRLEQRFGDWRQTTWQDLTPYLLRKFVVGLHSNLAYEKQGRLLQLDGDQIRGNHAFNDVWADFPRLRSALTILQDLALLEEGEEGGLRLTVAGRTVLTNDLGECLQ